MQSWQEEKTGSGNDKEIARSEEDFSVSGDDQARSKQDLQSTIWLALKHIKMSIPFACSAVNASLPNPGLQLMDDRVIRLPLSPDDALKIISLANPSYFGKGEETLVDDSVQRCWELNPTQFSLKNPEWSKAMNVMVDSVITGLGILKGTWKISAELKKLLLYAPGAFLQAQRDTEKSPCMLATLVVCLPSPHEGGKLVLTHENEKYEFETSQSSIFSTSYVAYYAEIQYEVLPITSGYCFILTYNLMRQSDIPLPSYNLACGRVQQLLTLLQRYKMEFENEYELPPIFSHKLRHKYISHEIISELDPEMLGHWAAKQGLDTKKDQLMKRLCIAPSIADKVKFLRSVTNGFEASLQDPGSVDRADLKQWSGEALFLAISQLAELTRADGVSLGQLHKTVDWNLFQLNSTPIIQKARTVVKIAFTNEILSNLQNEPNQEQKSFIQSIIHNIWEHFVFCSEQPESVANNPKIKNIIKDEVKANDLHHLLKNTIKFIPPEYLETTVKPAILKAIPSASKECSNDLFLELVYLILQNQLAGFVSPTSDLAPLTFHKCFVQALLTKFLLNKVGLEPQPPTNWTLRAGKCKCDDCQVITKFLQDPVKKRMDFPVAKHRRCHLYEKFTNQHTDCDVAHGRNYDVRTVHREQRPYIWQITKHRRKHETARLEWLKNTETAMQSLSKLKNNELVNGKLEMYVQPYFNIIMKASVKELPDLESLVTTQVASNDVHSPRIDKAVEIGYKRSADKVALQNHETAKRTRE